MITFIEKHTNHLFLNFHSSNSSSTTSLASNSPKMNASDWAVPQSSRLKYRQQFNSLDKLMSGYLSGECMFVGNGMFAYDSISAYVSWINPFVFI